MSKNYKQESRGLNPKIILALTVLIALCAFAYWVFRDFTSELSSGDKSSLVQSALPELDVEPAKPAPRLKDGTTFLLIGSDKRWGSSERWGRSDTILLVRINSNTISILSLPRDLLVNIPGYGEDRINAAYSYGGPGLLIATVREYLGVTINHFFQISFDGFAEILDSLPQGGVFLPVDGRYYHSNDGLSASEQWSEIDLRPGYQKLRASDALSFVRFRHLDSDFYRAGRQQIFLREAARQIYNQTGGNIFQLRDFAQLIVSAGASDFSSLPEALRLASTLRKISPSRVLRLTMSGESVTGSSGAFYISASEKEKQETVKLWSNPESVLNKQRSSRPLKGDERQFLRFFVELNRMSQSTGSRKIKRNSSRLLAFIEQSFARGRARVAKNKGNKNSKVTLEINEEGALLSKKRGLRTCSPRKLPPGYFWPEEARHSYRLQGQPSLALYATAGSGKSILWMWSKWLDAPILSDPDDILRTKTRQYSLFWESGSLRMIAWREGGSEAWITNTLLNDLSPGEMIALAESCR